MKILINGKEDLLMVDSLTLTDLLQQKGIESSWLAVAINQNFIPKSLYGKTIIVENDQIELVTPHPGG